MGKPTEDGRQQQPGDLEAGADGSFCCCCCRRRRGYEVGAVVAKAFTFRCVFVLLLSACVFLSAIFWIPPFSTLRSGRSRHGVPPAPIQASFILQKPVSFLSMHKERLEYDIFDEIGVPDTRVSVISMNPLTPLNSTYVVFGVLPDSKHVPNTINSVFLSVLRSSLMELVLQQWNLSLTRSIFGQPSSFEILKFPGGITIIPLQSAPIWQITQNLFNFTLNYSIIQIQKNLDELKGQLKYGLDLKYYENVYVQMTNLNGSTIEPPVIVEASILSDVGGRSLLPPRLKQLAQTITGSPAKNLGLNHTVFGKVKEVVLSSYLNHSISGAPSPSPSPADSLPSSAPPTSDLSPPPSPTAPSTDPNNISPCSYCITVPPSQRSPSYVPPPRGWSQVPTPEPSSSPSPLASSPVARSQRHYPCFPPEVPPNASPHGNPQAPATSDYLPPVPTPSPHKPPGPTSKLPRALSPAPIYHYSGESSMSPLLAAGPVSPTPTSNFASHSCIEMWLFGLLLILLYHLL